MESNEQEFNFWPAFSDVMVSVVLVLVLIAGTLQLRLSVEGVAARTARSEQESVIKSFDHQPYVVRFGVGISGVVHDKRTGTKLLSFEQQADPFWQKITFNEQLLFKPDRADLSSNGKTLLDEVAKSLTRLSKPVREIQIHGHTDTIRSIRFGSNLELGSARANAVYSYLVNSSRRIDPNAVLISATSYGEYSPVDREHISAFSGLTLEQANGSEAKRALNRRVELLVFYPGDTAKRLNKPK